MFAETFKRVFVIEEILAVGCIPARGMFVAHWTIDVGMRTDEAEVGAGVGSATIEIIGIPVGVPAPRKDIGVEMVVSDRTK
jgi:hypothetical protein